MSIEQKLEALTLAVTALTAAVQGAAGAAAHLTHATPPAEMTGDTKPGKSESTKAAGKKDAATRTTAAAQSDTAPAKKGENSAAAPESSDAEVTYDADVRPLFLQLIGAKGKPAGRAIIDHFDSSKDKLGEALTSQAQLREAKAMIEKALAA